MFFCCSCRCCRRRDTTGEIRSIAADFARELYREALAKAATMEPDRGTCNCFASEARAVVETRTIECGTQEVFLNELVKWVLNR